MNEAQNIQTIRDMYAAFLTRRGFEIAEAADGRQALEQSFTLQPDLVVMDLSLPGMSGIEATSRLANSHPQIAVVVLTVMTDEADLIDAILAGASSYLLKDASLDDIIAGVESAARGESIIAPQLAGKLLRRIRSRRGEIGAPRPQLTEREREVLELMIEGRDNATIAARLYISQNTVKHHVAAILDKLDVDNRVQAAVRAVRGWMT